LDIPINFEKERAFTSWLLAVCGDFSWPFMSILGWPLTNATPHEQMQREVDYVRAQQILTSMLEKGLITLSEFNKITELNRKTFSPLLAEIMP
jgi:hypothetical protein